MRARSLAAAAALAFSACTAQNANGTHAAAVRTPSPRPSPAATPFPPAVLLPGHRIVAYYGAADTPAMGVLGTGSIAQIEPKLLRQAAAYRKYGPVIPAFELIAVEAQRDGGYDGAYSAGFDSSTVQRYVRAAAAMHGIVILDIQPGRAAFLPLVKHYERFLRMPNVSLALDSEWSMGPNEVPGDVIGGTDAATVNEVSAYLSDIVTRYRLPQKLLVVHQFTPDMIENRSQVVQRPGLALVFHVDGFGDRPNKLSKYAILSRNAGPCVHGAQVVLRSGHRYVRSRRGDAALAAPEFNNVPIAPVSARSCRR
ncbi:MAG TPA: hypothetical protein VFL13_08090 [Candidatus Baltobacteraceae bacterium]|nr:hypothetical protein [Candidatus Baltobacteraceae bacterium]